MTLQKLYESEGKDLYVRRHAFKQSGLLGLHESLALNKLWGALLQAPANFLKISHNLNIILRPLLNGCLIRHYLTNEVDRLNLSSLYDHIIHNFFSYPRETEFFSITGYSKRKSLQMLKDLTSLSLRQLVERLRLFIAMKEILYTSKSITDIAYECGYSELSAFSRSVQVATGYAPTN